jgi:MarR family transcriptional regulator, transcriptional regulator for hemolysin
MPIEWPIGYPRDTMTIAAATNAARDEPASRPLADNLGWMLAQASHVLQTELQAAFEELGFGPRGFCVLSAALDGEHTQRELADIVGLDKTTMVVTVDELERSGLAERRPSPTDRRARIIAVTDAGRAAIERGAQVRAKVEDDVLGSLDRDQKDAFLEALGSLVCGRLATPAPCQRAPRRRA